VIADAGFDGLVVRISTRGIGMLPECGGSRLVTASAGESWDEIVRLTVDSGLAGLECLSGIPGTVGATPVQNVGAYGAEISEHLVRLRAWDRQEGSVATFAGDDCGFGYRTSRFRREPDRFAILDATFRLEEGGGAEIRYAELRRLLGAGAPRASSSEVRRAVLELRRAKSMVIDPLDENRRSAGSFFLNPIVSGETRDEIARRAVDQGIVPRAEEVPSWPTDGGKTKLSAAWLIEKAGFVRGMRRGSVGISTRHSLALVHHGGGTANELLSLAREIRSGVVARWGLRLEPEPVFAGFASPPLD
jgi:UDP-N-acetylmuramate dehydrogenase